MYTPPAFLKSVSQYYGYNRPLATKAPSTFSASDQENIKSTNLLQNCIEKLSNQLPSNTLTAYMLRFLNWLCGYKAAQNIATKSINNPPLHHDAVEAIRMMQEIRLAGKGQLDCAESVIALVKKEKSARKLEDLIAIGLIQAEQLENVNLTEIQRHFVCSDQVIVSLFEGLTVDYKDLEKLPDHLVQNLHNARRQIEIVHYLTQNQKEAIQNPWLMRVYTANWYTPMHLAIIQNDTHLIRDLLKYGYDVHDQTLNGSSLLSIAAQYGNLDIIQLFLDNKIPAHSPNQDGDIPLHFAAYYGHPLAVQALVQAYPQSVHQVNHRQLSALHFAALTGNAGIIRTLLEHGAPIDAVDEYQCTALHMTSATGHLNATDALIEGGAADIVNVYGELPLLSKPRIEYAKFQKMIYPFEQNISTIKHAKTPHRSRHIHTPSTRLIFDREFF